MEQIGFKCNRGVVRKNNEDACFVIPSHDVYIVADGVGGNNSGEVASNTAVEEIAEFVRANNLKACETPEDIFTFFTRAIDVANKRIFDKGNASPETRGMATTMVLAHLKDDSVYIANVGDSRAYLFRNDRLKRVTKDHTYVNELIDKGYITKDEAETHKKKNVITKALGADRYVEPDFYKVDLRKGDIILLCSDGLYGEVEEGTIAGVLAVTDKMNDAAARLVDEAIKAGGRDNITVVCIKN